MLAGVLLLAGRSRHVTGFEDSDAMLSLLILLSMAYHLVDL